MTFVLISVLASYILVLFLLRVNAFNEQWVPFIPDANQVELSYWEKNGTWYMNVSIWFSSTGYNVSDWGTSNIVEANISVNTEIWDWTGVDMPMVTMKSHTYSLGNLSAREYLFVFKAWNSPVKDTTFIVPEFPSILLSPLFTIATLLAVIVYKKKHSSKVQT